MRKSVYFGKKLSAFCFAAALAGLTGCGTNSPLDPENPVSLTVWHYYNGSQQAAFDALVEEFNDTVGREKGIYVEGYSQGSVSDLESAVRDSIAGKVGAEAIMRWSRRAPWPICPVISPTRNWKNMWILILKRDVLPPMVH